MTDYKTLAKTMESELTLKCKSLSDHEIQSLLASISKTFNEAFDEYFLKKIPFDLLLVGFVSFNTVFTKTMQRGLSEQNIDLPTPELLQFSTAITNRDFIVENYVKADTEQKNKWRNL